MASQLENLRKIRRDFHKYPELGFQEKRTKSKIANYLKELGLDVQCGSGIIGVLRGGDGGKVIGLRADMDALPIQETNTHNYISKNKGVMHACGHDGHMAMLLGAAHRLSTNVNFKGTIVFIFQPNEELGLGAKAMIDEGLLENFPIEEIYGIHNLPGVPTGELLTRPGIICSSESLFEIKIKGMGGHSSMPQLGRDAITIGAEVIQSLQTIISRRIASGSGAVVSATEFISNGQRNVLAGETIIKGDVRTRRPDDRKKIELYLNQITSGIASAHDIEIEVFFETEFIETINHIKPTEAVVKTAKKSGLKITDCKPMSFSEDFAHFSNAVPGCFFLLGNGMDGANNKPLHSSDYDFNDDLLPIGADFWASLVKNRLSTEGKSSV
jgi:hippurate hydrolase